MTAEQRVVIETINDFREGQKIRCRYQNAPHPKTGEPGKLWPANGRIVSIQQTTNTEDNQLGSVTVRFPWGDRRLTMDRMFGLVVTAPNENK